MAVLGGGNPLASLLCCTAVPILTRLSLPGCVALFLGVGVTLPTSARLYIESGGHALNRESQDSRSTEVMRTMDPSQTSIPACVTLFATISLLVRLHQPLKYQPGALEGIPTLRHCYLRCRQLSLNML